MKSKTSLLALIIMCALFLFASCSSSKSSSLDTYDNTSYSHSHNSYCEINNEYCEPDNNYCEPNNEYCKPHNRHHSNHHNRGCRR